MREDGGGGEGTSGGAAATVPFVLVVAAGSLDGLGATLRSLRAHSGTHASLVVACPDELAPQIEALVREAGGELLALGDDAGAGGALRAVAARAPHADVVLVREGVLVGPDWLDGLREAAYVDSIVMTASALCEALPGEADVDARAIALRAASARVRPTLAAALPGCCYVRAAALELVGAPDGSCVSDDAALAVLSERISGFGLTHVLADDVCVGDCPAADELREAEPGALRRALAVAESALRPLSVTVDARALGSAATGMRTYILDLIAALARERWLTLRVVLPPDTGTDVLAVLEADSAIELVSYEQAAAGVPLTDIVHRPQQVFTADDLALVRQLGERIVITHHDLIAYHAGSYHESVEQWRAYRRVTRLALASADMVIFPSRHAREDALREDLIAPARAHAVPDGAERIWPHPPQAQSRPSALPQRDGLLVCIGADYAHKNRPFAIALAGALHERHGWDGLLVLAGPHVPRGSSSVREREALERDPSLRSLVVDIGQVDDSERAWLYSHAQAIVYPSVYEGFGLVPFEAAQSGVPCLFAPVGALAELAGPAVATLVPWDAGASADAVAPLLHDGAPRERHLQTLQQAAATMSWANCMPQLRAVYEQALASPYRASVPRTTEDLERESYIVALAASAEHDRGRANELAAANDEAQRANDEAQRARDELHQTLAALRSSVGAFAEPAQGGLLSGPQRRGLLRIVSRPLLRRVLLAPFAALGRTGSAPK